MSNHLIEPETFARLIEAGIDPDEVSAGMALEYQDHLDESIDE